MISFQSITVVTFNVGGHFVYSKCQLIRPFNRFLYYIYKAKYLHCQYIDILCFSTIYSVVRLYVYKYRLYGLRAVDYHRQNWFLYYTNLFEAQNCSAFVLRITYRKSTLFAQLLQSQRLLLYRHPI